ncbi:MAG: hypothetical protein LAP61_28155, partial [Acidobacteriia bacterium]|nr:hypothetical protein [Terriglobia bacterium]
MLRTSILLLAFCPALVQAQSPVLTAQNDNLRTAANPNETTLRPRNVNATGFGRLFTRTLDGYLSAQPLFVPNATVLNSGVHNVVYVATMNNSVYAFDADDPNLSAPLWRTSLGPAVPAPYLPADETIGLGPLAGILSTPVIDPASATLYVVGLVLQDESPIYQLHALDLLTGGEKPNSPILVQASEGIETFNPSKQLHATDLLLVNGNIYFGLASYGNIDPERSWIFGYDAATLQQTAVQNLVLGRIGLSANSDGFVYACTGNGTRDGILKLGGSCLKLDPWRSLAVTDYLAGDVNAVPSLAYWDDPESPSLYVWGGNDRLKRYRFVDGMLEPNPASTSTAVVPYGAALSISSNGKDAGSGIVWATTPSAPPAFDVVPGALRAFDASDVSIELWNSDWNSSRDTLGSFAKFAAPTVANGKVYVATFSNQLVVYGLLPSVPVFGSPVVATSRSVVQEKRGMAMLAATAPTPATLPTGLIGRWTFDAADTSNTQAFDKSGNSYTGTLSGAITQTSGQVGDAYAFSNNGSINMGYASQAELNKDLTLAAWIKTTNSSRSEAFIAKYDTQGY